MTEAEFYHKSLPQRENTLCHSPTVTFFQRSDMGSNKDGVNEETPQFTSRGQHTPAARPDEATSRKEHHKTTAFMNTGAKEFLKKKQ